MKTPAITIVLFTAVVFSGCVKRQLEKSAIEVKPEKTEKDIRFTYEVKNEYSTEYFGMAGFVLENVTNKWMTVDSIEITSDEEQKSNMSILGGSDINTWFISMSAAKRIESANKQMLWGTISFAAAIGGATSKNENVQQAAGLTSVSAGALLTLEQFNSFKNQLKLYEYFPEDHLLRTPFRIPPGLGVDKWMVINSQVSSNDKLVTNLKLKLYFNGSESKEYFIELINDKQKDYYYSGKWQKNLIKRLFKDKRSR